MANNINQLNRAREKLISYEHKRDQLKGLDDLNAGLDILSEDLEDIDITGCNVTAKKLFTTYKSNSIEWIKEMIENCFGDEIELSILIYCRKLLETFEDANELIDPGSELNLCQQLIGKRFIEYLFGPSGLNAHDRSFAGKLSIEGQEEIIKLFRENPNIFIKSNEK